MLKIILAISLLAMASNTHATVFDQMNSAQSSVTFISHQMGVTVPGKFKRFTASLHFDPSAPQSSSAQVSIYTGSVDAGGEEVNSTLQDHDWFDGQHYPVATFSTTALSAVGNNSYRANGNLSIKGHVHLVTVQFHATATPAGMVLEGDLPISRTAYGIGGGEWADPSVIGDIVNIHFRLLMKSN